MWSSLLPFFACTDITISWTFLYRSSDCFNSSILRSCKVCNGLTQSEVWDKTNNNNNNKKKHLKVKSTFSSLATISDSTAFFILCTSTSSCKRKKVLHTKNGSADGWLTGGWGWGVGVGGSQLCFTLRSHKMWHSRVTTFYSSTAAAVENNWARHILVWPDGLQRLTDERWWTVTSTCSCTTNRVKITRGSVP